MSLSITTTWEGLFQAAGPAPPRGRETLGRPHQLPSPGSSGLFLQLGCGLPKNRYVCLGFCLARPKGLTPAAKPHAPAARSSASHPGPGKQQVLRKHLVRLNLSLSITLSPLQPSFPACGNQWERPLSATDGCADVLVRGLQHLTLWDGWNYRLHQKG